MSWWRHIFKRDGRATERADVVMKAEAVKAKDATSAHPHVQAIRYLVVREACEAGLGAIGRDDMKQAKLHAEHAWSLDPTHPDAIRLKALLAMLSCKANEAVDLLEKAGPLLPSMCLLMHLARLQNGQREAAHMDLHAWSRHETCPMQARQLLAFLEHKAGDDAAARNALQRNMQDHVEPASAQMLWLIDRLAGWRDSAKQTAALLSHRLPHHEPTLAFERLMGLADRVPKQVPVQMIDQLAAELIEEPDTIASLVAAQKQMNRSQRVELLRRALGRVVDDLSKPMDAIVALAELAMLADDADDAKRWAMRGLRMDAYHAKLAMILDEADRRGDGSNAAEARASLQRAAALHGEYRDLQAALARRLAGGKAA